MVARSLVPRLTDIVEAIERVHGVLENISLQAFETDWQRQWLVPRGVEMISEVSRHLTEEMKARHTEIPWLKVAGIDRWGLRWPQFTVSANDATDYECERA